MEWMGKNGESHTWKHRMRGIANKNESIAVPAGDWSTIQELPQLDICRFTSRVVRTIIQRPMSTCCLLECRYEIRVEGLVLLQQIGRLCANVPVCPGGSVSTDASGMKDTD